MNYKIVGTYTHTSFVNTDSESFKHYLETQKIWHPKITIKEAAIKYSQRELDWDIIDDEGHGTLNSNYLDWSLEELK